MFFGSFSGNNHDAENNNMNKGAAEDHHEVDMVARFPHHYLHPHHHHHHYQQQQQQQQQKRECLSDEGDSSRSSGGGGEIKKPRPTSSGDDKSSKVKALVVFGDKGGEGATVDVAKRPRGRPPGSKNKPKPPVVVTREAEPTAAMRPHVLEIPSGHDVVDSLVRFCRRRNLGICLLSGTGAVANVALRQPSLVGVQGVAHQQSPMGATAAAIGFHGRFEILSMSATFLTPAMAALSPAASGTLSISLAGPQGQIIGGTVAGPLMAAGTVVVVAAAFTNPTFHRLPAEDDVSVSVSVSAGDGADVEEREQQAYQQQQRRHHGPPAVSGAAATATESCGMRIYSSHLPTDVIWTPTARPPPY